MSLALTAALEAVKFQIQPVLFEAVVQQVKKLRAENDYSTNSPQAKALSELLRRYTGLSVTVIFSNNEEIGAAALVPDLNRNHVLLSDSNKEKAGSRNILLEMRRRDVRKLDGWVDLKNGKVHGVFSDVGCYLEPTESLMRATNFTHEEVAAIFLHEIGHIITHFEYVHRSVTTNYALLSVAEAMVSSPNEVRVELLDATSRYFNMDRDDLEGLQNSNNKDTAYSVLITRHIQQTRAELGANIYDQRGCEFLADQYVARMGGGSAMVTASAKLYRRDTSRYSTAQYLLFEGMKLTLVALSTYAISPIFIVAMMVAYDPTDKIYDDPEARMKRLRNELLGAVKNRDLPRARKEQLKKDLEITDAAIKEYNDRRTFYEFLYTTFLPGARDQHKRMKYQQELEALANNELFSKAMNFSLLKG